MTTLGSSRAALAVVATRVRFENDMMYVELQDGREIGVPLEWFPTIRDASPEQRSNWRLIGRGVGIHWEDLDEDLSVEGLLRAG
ncbi:MAG TPA: DUF2442 domain-containing protein [Chloroflexota bacterium]|nr:DUF2442 domain-containing protein [Chloroflexota bacterium]